MSSRVRKSHTSKWLAIEVCWPGEPSRTYRLNDNGRLSAADVPRNPRRSLTHRADGQSAPMPPMQPPNPPLPDQASSVKLDESPPEQDFSPLGLDLDWLVY
jgi:hypothetical protein